MLAARQEFIAAVDDAAARGVGLAAGKMGNSERRWLEYPVVLAQEVDPLRRRAYELALGFQSVRAAGVFPTDPDFLRCWCARYVEHVRQLDWIGVWPELWTAQLELLRWHGLEGRAMHWKDQQPDRSSPADEDRCYLPALRGRRVLLVSPFATLLRERATRSTFEAVWARTGKPWFEPAAVEAIDLPYGFEPETRSRYATALDLLDEVADELRRTDFDVALIGAGGLGVGIAGVVKSLGKVGISLGGHLQVVFGVLGDRWRSKGSWQRRYFNDAWIDMPERYVPQRGQTLENYW